MKIRIRGMMARLVRNTPYNILANFVSGSPIILELFYFL